MACVLYRDLYMRLLAVTIWLLRFSASDKLVFLNESVDAEMFCQPSHYIRILEFRHVVFTNQPASELNCCEIPEKKGYRCEIMLNTTLADHACKKTLFSNGLCKISYSSTRVHFEKEGLSSECQYMQILYSCNDHTGDDARPKGMNTEDYQKKTSSQVDRCDHSNPPTDQHTFCSEYYGLDTRHSDGTPQSGSPGNEGENSTQHPITVKRHPDTVILVVVIVASIGGAVVLGLVIYYIKVHRSKRSILDNQSNPSVGFKRREEVNYADIVFVSDDTEGESCDVSVTYASVRKPRPLNVNTSPGYESVTTDNVTYDHPLPSSGFTSPHYDQLDDLEQGDMESDNPCATDQSCCQYDRLNRTPDNTLSSCAPAHQNSHEEYDRLNRALSPSFTVTRQNQLTRANDYSLEDLSRHEEPVDVPAVDGGYEYSQITLPPERR